MCNRALNASPPRIGITARGGAIRGAGEGGSLAAYGYCCGWAYQAPAFFVAGQDAHSSIIPLVGR